MILLTTATTEYKIPMKTLFRNCEIFSDSICYEAMRLSMSSVSPRQANESTSIKIKSTGESKRLNVK